MKSDWEEWAQAVSLAALVSRVRLYNVMYLFAHGQDIITGATDDEQHRRSELAGGRDRVCDTGAADAGLASPVAVGLPGERQDQYGG